MNNIPILIDGPNYINRILELEIKPSHIARQLSLDALRETLSKTLKDIPRIHGECESIEFFCSKKLFGPSKSKFSQEQQEFMIDRLRSETGSYVDIIDLPGTSEKGVDMTISGKLEDYSSDAEAIILVTADRDFIPTIKKLRHKAKIILVSLNEKYPIELTNEAYTTISLCEEYNGLFRYSYPRFFINDLTKEKCSELYSEADDRNYNQLRVTDDGYVFISKKVGAQDIHGVRFRFETFVEYNGYTGPKAASDDKYISNQHNEIIKAWELGAKGYIDYPVESVWRSKE